MRKYNFIVRAIVLSAVVVFCFARALKGSDFDIYLLASEGLKTQVNIYDAHLTDDVQYFYSPFFALALLPWTYLPYFFAKFLWLLLISFLLFRIVRIVQGYFSPDDTTKKQKSIITILPLIILAGFIIDNYHMIQVTIFMLWGTMESINLINSNRKLLGGSLLGLLINIKLLPLPFLPYLIYRKQFAAVIVSLFVSLLLIYLPSTFIGTKYNDFLISNWWKTINPQNAEHILETNILVFNIPALITSLFLDNSTGALSIDTKILKNLINTISGLVILSSFLFFKFPPFTAPKSRLHEIREVSFLLVATILLFPHQNKYANVYLYPALHYILYFLFALYNTKQPRTKIFIRTSVVFLIISIFFISLTGKSIVGTSAYYFLSYHKSITIGTLILIPMLYFMNPAILEKYKRRNISEVQVSAADQN